MPPQRPAEFGAAAAEPAAGTREIANAAEAPHAAAAITRVEAAVIPANAGLAAASAQAYASTAASVTYAQPITAPVSPAPAERLPITKASFTPGAGASFNASRRDYGYAPPASDDSEPGLQLQSMRPGFEKTTKLQSIVGQRYYAAYSNTEISCFPQRLRDALNTIAMHYGKDVEVTSGARHNGRRGSYHRKCMAADIRVEGVTPGQLTAFAKTVESINGVGSYHHNNVVHVDVREYQMSWRY